MYKERVTSEITSNLQTDPETFRVSLFNNSGVLAEQRTNI